MDETSNLFLAELGEARRTAETQGRRYHYATMSLTVIALLSGFVATLLASSDDIAGYLRGIAAAIPALCAALLTSLKLQERANWSYLLVRHLDGVASEVRYGGLPLDEASRRLQQLRLDHEHAYPILKTLPKDEK